MRILVVLAALVLVNCQGSKRVLKGDVNLENQANTGAMDTEWTYLFDGSSLDGWRNYNKETLSEHWVIKDGAMTFDTQMKLEADKKGGGDLIYAKEEFDNFELYWEWKIPEGGNSGMLYHVKEGYSGPPEVSPEYQMLDDLKWEELNDSKLSDWQKTGADYAMYSADESNKKIKAAGEWNSSRIIFTKEKVEYFLNGQKTVEFVPWSDDWKKRKEEGKWKDSPDYGKFEKGYIAIQDHDSPIWLKEIKIKRL